MKNAPPPRLKLQGRAPPLRLPKTVKPQLVSTPQGRLVYRRPCFLCGKQIETGQLADHLQRECGR